MPRAIDRLVGPPGAQHIDAYQEYTNLVGRLDGGTLLSEPAYEALRKRASDPARRLYVYWRHKGTGLDCKAIGPQTLCFCGHRYNEHDWEAFESRVVRCKMPGCNCTCFNYVPVRGAQDLQCSICHRSFRDHRPDHGCPTGGTRFASSYNCSCTGTYSEHETVFESRFERERAGRPVDAGWMEQAAREGLPVCHLGGVVGFASLADGVDRMYAGLESDEVAQAVAARGGITGDAGANRFVERCMLEDTVNTAALVNGRAAGHQAIAQARRRSAAGSASGGSRGSRQRAITTGPRMSGAASNQSAPAESSAPRSNIHTLAGSAAAQPGAAGPAPQPRRARAAAADQHGPAAGRGPRRSATSMPPLPSSAVPAGGRRLGGVRHHDQASMREARLARLDG